MDKKKIIIFAIVMLSVFVVMIAKGSFGDKGYTQPVGKLVSDYNQFLAASGPSLIVFSYDGECCPGTEEFFVKFNTQVDALVNDYRDFKFLRIDAGAVPDDDQPLLLKIAQDYGVTLIPSLVVLDSEGNVAEVYVGLFDNTVSNRIYTYFSFCGGNSGLFGFTGVVFRFLGRVIS